MTEYFARRADREQVDRAFSPSVSSRTAGELVRGTIVFFLFFRLTEQVKGGGGKRVFTAVTYTHVVLFDGYRRSGAAIEHAQQVDADAEKQSQFHVENQTGDERGRKRQQVAS